MSDIPTQTTIELPPPDVHAVPVSLMLADSVTVEPLSPAKIRTEEIRQKIDPDRTLPELMLKPAVWDTALCEQVLAAGGEWNEVYDANNRKVGVLATRPAKHSKNIVEIAYISRREGVTDKGVGTAMYLLAIQYAVNHGKILTNDSNGVSTDAKKMWEKFARLEVAEKRKDFVFDDDSESYAGRYVILPR